MGYKGVYTPGTVYNRIHYNTVLDITLINLGPQIVILGYFLLYVYTFHSRYNTRIFANAKTKAQISFAVTAKLISTFAFATRIEQFLFFLNLKFQASNHLLRLYRPVCVGPGQKPQRPVFSRRSSNGMLPIKVPSPYPGLKSEPMFSRDSVAGFCSMWSSSPPIGMYGVLFM